MAEAAGLAIEGIFNWFVEEDLENIKEKEKQGKDSAFYMNVTVRHESCHMMF